MAFAPHRSRRSALCAALALSSLALAGTSWAQEPTAQWPSKPIKLIVPYTPGGSTDIVSRTVFEAVGKRLGQPVVIENKPGANSTIGVTQTARAPADGYNFVSVLAAYTVNMSLYKKLPYQPSDLVAVSHVADLPMFLFAANKLPVKNAKELVEYGKTHPLNYASSGTGASAHMIGARWAQENGLNAQHVPYNGSAPILADLVMDTLAAARVRASATVMGMVEAVFGAGSATAAALGETYRPVEPPATDAPASSLPRRGGPPLLHR